MAYTQEERAKFIELSEDLGDNINELTALTDSELPNSSLLGFTGGNSPRWGLVPAGNVGGNYDVSKNFPTGGVGGTNRYTLSEAIVKVPSGLRTGGMTIRFVDSVSSKYVEWRLMAQSFSTIESNWQGVDDEPTAESVNLVKSGGVKKYIDDNIFSSSPKLSELNIVNCQRIIDNNNNWWGNLLHVDKAYGVFVKYHKIEQNPKIHIAKCKLVGDTAQVAELDYDAKSLTLNFEEGKIYAVIFNKPILFDENEYLAISPCYYAAGIPEKVSELGSLGRFGVNTNTKQISTANDVVIAMAPITDSNIILPSGRIGYQGDFFGKPIDIPVNNSYGFYGLRANTDAELEDYPFNVRYWAVLHSRYAHDWDIQIAYRTELDNSVPNICYRIVSRSNPRTIYKNWAAFSNIEADSVPNINKFLVQNVSKFTQSYTGTDIWGNYTPNNHIDVAYGISFYKLINNSQVEISVYKCKVSTEQSQMVSLVGKFMLPANTGNEVRNFYFDKPVELKSDEYLGITSPFAYTPDANPSDSTAFRFRANIDGSARNNPTATANIGFSVLTNSKRNLEYKKKKTISIIGDSISTFGSLPGVMNPYYPVGDVKSMYQTWWGNVLNILNLNLCRLAVEGGSRVSNSGGGHEPLCDISKYGALYSGGTTGEAPDIIILFGGVNDWNGSIDLGSYTDDFTTVTNKFIPAYRGLLYNLQNTYKNSLIFCCTPIKSYYNTVSNYPPTKNGKSLLDYVNAVKECASLHGIKCIDLYNNVNINIPNSTLMLRDTLHPTALGCEMIGKYVSSKVREFL